MRIALILSSLAVAAFSFPSSLAAQNNCAPPSFRGPDGPRPSQPPADTGTGTGRNTGAGDTGRPTPSGDPTITGGPDRRGPITGPRGMAITYTRGKSSKKRLQIHWEYPKAKGEASLDYESALAEVRGNDPRPLLVLREGSQYGKGYDAMLQKKLRNEKLVLLTRWFHCVRFPSTIMEESHPYHSLFSGKFPPQVFVVSWDGTDNAPLSGVFSVGSLERRISKVLKKEYRKDPSKAVSKWLRVLNELDTIDSMEGTLRKQMDEVEFKEGPKSSKLKSLKAKWNKLQKRRGKARQREKVAMDLGLIRRTTKSNASKLLDRIRGTN